MIVFCFASCEGKSERERYWNTTYFVKQQILSEMLIMKRCVEGSYHLKSARRMLVGIVSNSVKRIKVRSLYFVVLASCCASLDICLSFVLLGSSFQREMN